MTHDQMLLVQEAKESIEAARLLLRGGFADYAASRAYYAMFYVAEAMLSSEGISMTRHSAVIAAFGQHLAHPGKVPVEFHRFLIEAAELRNQADYRAGQLLSAAVAEEQISRAVRFVEAAESLLGSP